MAETGTYFAVRLMADKNPAKGTIIAEAPGTGSGIPVSILALWKAGEVAVVWSRPMAPPRQLPEASLASVRQKRLRRQLDRQAPLLAPLLEETELARRPEFYSGKREETPQA